MPDSKLILGRLRDSLSSTGNLQTDKELTVGSFPGRELKIKNEKGIHIARFYLVGSRLYTISEFIPVKLECAEEPATKVLDSFELLSEK